MKLRILLSAVAVIAFVSTGALAADSSEKAKKQAEIDKATKASLERFYKSKPELKQRVEKAPGYAVFTTYGLSFLIGGAGGSGIARDNAAKKVTYMKMAQASAGVQIGLSESEVLIVFRSKPALAKFIDKGWEYSGGATAAAGGGDKAVGGGKGESTIAEADYFTMTKTGVEVGGAVQGTKFWKDGDLN